MKMIIECQQCKKCKTIVQVSMMKKHRCKDVAIAEKIAARSVVGYN